MNYLHSYPFIISSEGSSGNFVLFTLATVIDGGRWDSPGVGCGDGEPGRDVRTKSLIDLNEKKLSSNKKLEAGAEDPNKARQLVEGAAAGWPARADATGNAQTPRGGPQRPRG